MMRSCVIIVGLTLILSACNPAPPPLIKEVPRVVMPDPALFDCPVVDVFPDPDTLTDGIVAELLLTLDENNRRCMWSINAIRDFLDTAKDRLEEE